MALQHVVLFRFPEALDAGEEKRFRSMVADWPERIGGFRRLRLGPDLNDGERARGYQFLLLAEYDDEPALRAYQRHPAHVAFADWVRERGGEVLAFDYALDDETTLRGD